MCGIAAYLGSDTQQGSAFVSRTTRMLRHRGPDDEGIFIGEGIALGHRRLSIIDLTKAGHQPMTSPDGRWTLVYNGEIYNHQTLRSRLRAKWSFQGRSDCETLLAALSVHGPAIFNDLVGMWALALWDARQQCLLVSRDRYGQKPLYWRRMLDGALCFASEMSPLIEPAERPHMFAPA